MINILVLKREKETEAKGIGGREGKGKNYNYASRNNERITFPCRAQEQNEFIDNPSPYSKGYMT